MGMRKAFGEMMMRLAVEHENVVVLTADVASAANLQLFAEKFPERFFNVGIAEQNMVAIAAGLAKENCTVFVVSFAPFVAMRAYEAVRSLIGYMKLNVKLVALSSGFGLAYQGSTHYCLEDISIMRTIPGMSVFSPADCIEEYEILKFNVDFDGPAYIRLTGIDGVTALHDTSFKFHYGIPEKLVVNNEAKILIVSTGSVVSECKRVTRGMKEDMACELYNVSTLKPVNLTNIIDRISAYEIIIAVEEHFQIGGLGTIIADRLSMLSKHPVLLRIGIRDEFPSAASYADLMEQYELKAPMIKKRITDFVMEMR